MIFPGHQLRIGELYLGMAVQPDIRHSTAGKQTSLSSTCGTYVQRRLINCFSTTRSRVSPEVEIHLFYPQVSTFFSPFGEKETVPSPVSITSKLSFFYPLAKENGICFPLCPGAQLILHLEVPGGEGHGFTSNIYTFQRGGSPSHHIY